MNVTPLRSYRATVIPAGTVLEDVEKLALAEALSTLNLQAPNAEQAEITAYRTTRLPVYSVERIEPVAR